jgi:hypothetical protein
VPGGDGYLLDNRQAQAGQRFDALAQLFDPSTRRHLAAVGLGPAWRVWEVGAGGPALSSWLVLEEADPALQPLVCLDEHGPDQQLANRLKDGFRELLSQRSVDLAYGRTLPRHLRAAGLVDVEADAYFPLTGPACAELERATVEQIAGQLIATGLADQAEIEQHLANVASGRLDLATSPMVTAWGRRPPA